MSTSTRIKQTVANHGQIVFIFLLIISAISLFGSYTEYTNPATEIVTEQQFQQEVTTTTQTSAVVTGETDLYEQGRRLTNQPVYFITASPNLTINLSTRVPEGERVSISQELILQQEATRSGDIFWQESRQLVSTQQNVTDGSAQSTARINMSALSVQISDRREQISVGTFQTRLVLQVSYRTDRYSDTQTASVPITVTGNTYWLEEDLQVSSSHSKTTQRKVQRRNTGLIGGLAGLGLAALAGAVAIGYWHSRGPDMQQIETEMTTSRYEEWISEGELPTDTEKQYIYIKTLEDLVDVAIDSNKRVIHDPEFDAYSVPDGNMVYYYAEEPTMLNTWLTLSDDSE